jgi:hypothetical protein
MAAPSILSTVELSDASRATNTGSQAVTVPASCTGIAVFVGGYFSSAGQWSGGSVSLSTDGALTAYGTGADADGTKHQGAAFYLEGNLTAGSQTLSWDWGGAGAPTDGALMVVVFIGGGATASAIRDSDGIQSGSIGDGLLHSTKTLTAQTDDLILAFVEQFDPGTSPSPAWTNATSVADYDLAAPYRSTDGGLASATPTANQTVGVTWSSSGSNDGSLQALVIKPGTGAPPGQTAAPTADSVDGAWLNESGSATNLYASVDEATAVDTDYIESESAPASSAVRLKLDPSLADPLDSTGHVLHWRAGKDSTGGSQIDVTIDLYQGGGDVAGAGTLIATRSHTNVDALTTYDETLTGAEADAITNYGDLYVEITANQV